MAIEVWYQSYAKSSTRPGKHTNIAIENGPVEIVDLPSYKMVIFHSYVAVYQRVIFYLDVWGNLFFLLHVRVSKISSH